MSALFTKYYLTSYLPMINVVSFRPRVIQNGTAFEAMATIYKYLQTKYDYSFTIIKSESDNYQDPELKIISLPTKQWQINPYLKSFSYIFKYKKPIVNLFKEADLVLTVDPTIYQQGVTAIEIANLLRKPVWFDTSRTDLAITQTIGRKFKRRWLKSLMHKTTGIIVTVPKCIERFRSLGLFDQTTANKFTIMGHPVNLEQFRPYAKTSEQDKIIRVIVVSRLIPEKGLYYILEAMSAILNQRQDVRWQLLGSGLLESWLRQEITNRKLQERVDFLSPVSHQQLPAILAQADIFVNHAISIAQWEEFFGVANIEAMACGLPCVVSNSGGIPYVIREQDVAAMVEERNIIQLQEAISSLINSASLREQMGDRARSYVQNHYSLSSIGDKYHNMLQKSINSQHLITNN